MHRPAGQIVLVDTPGLHKPKSLLGKRLNDVVRDTLSDVDVIVFCVPADQPVGAGDAFIARQLREVRRRSSSSSPRPTSRRRSRSPRS